MAGRRVYGFADDVLADHDAVELARMVRAGSTTAAELAAAAAVRAERVEPDLHAIAHAAFDQPRLSADNHSILYGVPTFVKDNTDVAGMPTNHGSEAFQARPARRDGRYTRQFLGTGVTVLGKSRMPEFGFNATTEFATGEPTRNPWNIGHSVGASSGGAAALVSSGVVPIAHANDGGGSIRIPAACTGLVGLKFSRGRHIDSEQARVLPLKIITEGVLTRTVRDTAAFATAMDRWRNATLPPIPEVSGPTTRRLRIGVVLDTVTGAAIDEPTRDAVERVAAVFEDMGLMVEPIGLPVGEQFAVDFLQYWTLLADLAVTTGKLRYGNSFDPDRLDGLTAGLHRRHRRTWHRTPGALYRLHRCPQVAARMFAHHDVILSPVLAHIAPDLGFLSPKVEFDELVDRLTCYVAFTPPNNLAGIPGLSVPAGLSEAGLPIGVQLSAAYGDERTLLELGFALEAARPFPRIA